MKTPFSSNEGKFIEFIKYFYRFDSPKYQIIFSFCVATDTLAVSLEFPNFLIS